MRLPKFTPDGGKPQPDSAGQPEAGGFRAERNRASRRESMKQRLRRAISPRPSKMTTTMSTWKDLPRRILTVTVGVPSIILLLRNPVTAWLFFQGAHLLCLLEWRALAPDAGRTAPAGKTAGVDSEGSGSLIHRLRARILLEGTSEDTPLRRLMFCVFVAASIIATIAPTELLPLVAMAHGVALRLAPHLPRFRPRDCVDSTRDEVNALLGI